MKIILEFSCKSSACFTKLKKNDDKGGTDPKGIFHRKCSREFEFVGIHLRIFEEVLAHL